MKKIKKEIERLVNKYPWPDSEDLFRAELEHLVLIAEREQMKLDRDMTMKILNELVNLIRI